MDRRQRYDVVVIGAGTAGLVAGARLAEAGAAVCVIAKGVGSTHLAPGTIDVLGYGPERVESPAERLPSWMAEHPEHPYARIGAETLESSSRWFYDVARCGPLPDYAYVGGLQRNRLLPTALGVLRPSALVSTTFSQGDVAQLTGRVAIVGTPALRDFHAGLCAANLRASGIDAVAVELELELDRADANALGIARSFDDGRWRAQVAAQLARRLQGADRVGLPAVVGMSDPHGAFNDLIDRIETPVFEIPTLPPSVPGIRLFGILQHALRAAGGRLVIGAGVVSHRREGERVLSVETATAGSNTRYEADAFVLASGGFHSGAITLDSHWQAREQVLGLDLTGVPGDGLPRFVGSYRDEQPLARCGVAVDSELRALGTANVVVAGASLPGSVSWREGSGEGIALASGYRAAQVLAAQLGAEAMA